MRLSPLGNVAGQRDVSGRFALALPVVCTGDFQGPGLRKHPGVGLELSCNGAGGNPLSLVNPSLSNLLSSSAVHGGVVDKVVHNSSGPTFQNDTREREDTAETVLSPFRAVQRDNNIPAS